MKHLLILIINCLPALASCQKQIQPRRSIENLMVSVNVKVFLQGAFDTSTSQMHTRLHDTVGVQTNQPFSGAPYYYQGAEWFNVQEQPGAPRVVAWILIELRNGKHKTVGWSAALVRKNGTVVDYAGNSPVNVTTKEVGPLYVLIHHTSHLSVRAKQLVNFQNYPPGKAPYIDFTFDPGYVFQREVYTSTVQVGPTRVYAMRAGDASGNGIVSLKDDSPAIKYAYSQWGWFYPADINMDGYVNGKDSNFLSQTLGAKNATYKAQLK